MTNLARRPPLGLKAERPAKDPAHMARVATLACVCCGARPVHVHHCISGRFGQRKAGKTLLIQYISAKIGRRNGCFQHTVAPDQNVSDGDSVMAKRQLPCPTVARLLIQYDKDTGKLFWKPRAACFFTSGYFDKQSNAARWNSRYSGRETFNHPSKNGYLNGQVFDIGISAHRIAWAIFYGAWPEQEIDHINRIKTDNRICNLRQTDRFGNCLNRGANKSRGAHPKGVFKSCGGRWMARIGYKGKSLHGGTFDTIAQASARYMQMHDVITGAIQCPADLQVVANAMALGLTENQ